MNAHFHPMGNPASIASGAQKVPDLPDEFYWIEMTAAINRLLQSNYTIEQVQLLPSDQLELLQLRIVAPHQHLDYDDSEDDLD